MKKSFIENEDSEQARLVTKKFRQKLSSEMLYKSIYRGDTLSFEWVDRIEEACPRLETIIMNAKVALIQEGEIELVEKTKRVGVESVKYLARHTNDIRKIDEKTHEVEPKKLLNIRNEETYNIYENRFLHTLVYLIDKFIYEREKELKNMEVSDQKLLEYVGKTETPTERVRIEVKVTSGSIPDDNISQSIQEEIEKQLKRLKKIKEYMAGWMKSPMITALDAAHIPPVKPPLKKTNILLKNQNFRVATALWEYLNNFGIEDPTSDVDNIETNGNDIIQGFMDHAFLIDYYVLDSVSNSKKEQKKQLSKYAVVMLTEEIKRIIKLLTSCGIKITEEEIMKLVGQELKDDKSDRLIGVDDVKKKFKSAMDEYLERTQEYL